MSGGLPPCQDLPKVTGTPGSRWNPLKYFPTPFQERDGSFEYCPARGESSPTRPPTIPGAFTPTPPVALNLHGGAHAPGGAPQSPHLLSPSPLQAPARPAVSFPLRDDLDAPPVCRRPRDPGDPHGDLPWDHGDPRDGHRTPILPTIMTVMITTGATAAEVLPLLPTVTVTTPHVMRPPLAEAVAMIPVPN